MRSSIRDWGDRFLQLGVRANLSAEEQAEFLGLFGRLGSTLCWRLAEQEQVLAAVATTITSLLPAKDTPKTWQNFVAANKTRVSTLISDLGKVCGILDQQGISSAAMEAGGVMLATSLPVSAYGSGDIDLLVESGKAEEVDRAMESAGYELQNRTGRVTTSRREYRKPMEQGRDLWLDAGPRVFDRTWAPYAFRIPNDVWLARPERAAKSQSIWVLSPTDLLVQVAIHTSTHSYLRAPGLRLHIDVDRVVRDLEIDWTVFVQQAQTIGAATRIGISLLMARNVMGTPIDTAIIEALLPDKWRRALIDKVLASHDTVGQKTLERYWSLVLDALLDDRGLVPWSRELASAVVSKLRS